jgi:Ni,Fe-hydrogenase III small subunit
MIEVPSAPGALEYRYQAASLVSGLLSRGGTWMVPSGLRPTSNTFECTPMAGMAIDTGADGVIRGPWTAGARTAGAAERVTPGDAGIPGGFPVVPGCR